MCVHEHVCRVHVGMCMRACAELICALAYVHVHNYSVCVLCVLCVLCVCVCVCMCVCTCVVCVCTCMGTYFSTGIYFCVLVCVCSFPFVSLFSCFSLSNYTYLCVSLQSTVEVDVKFIVILFN